MGVPQPVGRTERRNAKMKKLAAFAVWVAVLAVSVTAFADASVAYTGGEENTATVTGINGYSTVLITDSENNIVYINEETSTFSGIKDFLMKSDSLSIGEYTARFGSDSGNPITTTFYVGVQSEGSGDVPMTRLSSNRESDDKYSTGFFRTVSANEYGNYNSLKVGYNNGSQDVWGGFNLKEYGFPQTTGGGDLTLIFELNEIEEDEIGSVSVFLSTDQVGDRKAYQE